MMKRYGLIVSPCMVHLWMYMGRVFMNIALWNDVLDYV